MKKLTFFVKKSVYYLLQAAPESCNCATILPVSYFKSPVVLKLFLGSYLQNLSNLFKFP